jgi:murein DD-endopeptidase MepM/ murein hydrolase activator NlpD
VERLEGRVVMWVMNSSRVVGAIGLVASFATACARPVLYYPVPESESTSPGPAGTTSAATETHAPVASASDEFLLTRHIVLPVAGADMSKVEDSYSEPRDGGRVHRAIDILAPRGTPILSADDGKILRMTTNTLGGISMYTVDTENRLVYYYAHMDHYNDAMSPGRAIVKGDTLGYVGTTGNAPKDTPHLHFQVMRWPADGKYWNGDPIDPYEALGGAARADRGKHNAGQPYEY